MGGDSHTELCVPNAETHFGVLERELTATGMNAAVFAYGAGKYSLPQAYLALADETGWLFVDNLAPLPDYSGPERLYNDFDYHVRPVASEIIGQNQAAAIVAHLDSRFTAN